MKPLNMPSVETMQAWASAPGGKSKLCALRNRLQNARNAHQSELDRAVATANEVLREHDEAIRRIGAALGELQA